VVESKPSITAQRREQRLARNDSFMSRRDGLRSFVVLFSISVNPPSAE
jgi:hypothetical protein